MKKTSPPSSRGARSASPGPRKPRGRTLGPGSRLRRVRDDDGIWNAFNVVVNLTPAELKAWLKRDESKQVGFVRPGEIESVGRQSAKAILKIQAKPKAALTDADYAHMRKVIGYVRRHRAQRPRGDITHTRWRYSLLNWGHDPLLEEYRR